MIKAVMYWERFRLEVTGHAGYEQAGKDIVCAAASMLDNALAGALDEMEQRGRCEMKAVVNEMKGSFMVWANPTMGAVSECKAYFRMAVKGFRMLQQAYPGLVSIREVQ